MTQADSGIDSQIEALLFVSNEPVSVLTLADALGCNPIRVEEALSGLQQKYVVEGSGIRLQVTAGGWRLVTAPEHHDLIERYVVSWDTRKLTQAALETLAIVAYCQPVTRSGIASVRGVNSDSSVNSLLEKGYLREVGTQDAPGNPALLGTTKMFLDRFGLCSVSELPPLESFAPDEETRAFIAERLNVVPSDVVAEIPEGLSDGPSVGDEPEEEAESVEQAMSSMLAEALASSAGVVEKIDFDSLIFEED